jgi:hypothetical protein
MQSTRRKIWKSNALGFKNFDTDLSGIEPRPSLQSVGCRHGPLNNTCNDQIKRSDELNTKCPVIQHNTVNCYYNENEYSNIH